MPTAKVFRNGRSQAVRLPKEFRFDVDEVDIRKEGVRVNLQPVKKRPWPRGYWSSWSKVPDDFAVPEPLASRVPDLAVEDWL